GFFAGLIGLDFVSSILIYLMMVVHFTYWPDVARTTVLIGLHAAGAIVLMKLKPHLPCNAFGGWTVCDRLTNAILIGSWTITGLLMAYGACLPFMAGLRVPVAESDAEKTADRAGEEERSQKGTMAEEEEAESTDARAWLLRDPEGASPEANPLDLPLRHSHGSSLSSTALLPQSKKPLLQDVVIDSDHRVSGIPDSGYWTSPRTSIPHTPRPPSSVVTDATTAGVPGFATNLPPPQQSASPVAVNHVEDDEATLVPPQHRNSYETASVYSQPSGAPSRATTMTARGPKSQREGEVTNAIQEDGDVEVFGRGGDYLGPPLTALPIPDYTSSPGTAQTTFELHLSDSSRPPSTNVGELLNIVASGPSRPHERKDSGTSNVDMDEWRKLVLGAAGKI
ncbi:hypothetical protein ID866_3696, partial [Astraeus odoratus]